MARTGHIVAKNCSVDIYNSAGAKLSISDHGNTVDIDISMSETEAPNYGDKYHEYEADMWDWTINYSGWWAGSATANLTQSPAACLLTTLQTGTGGTIKVWPAGSTAGSIAYTACCNFTAFPMSFPRDGFATMSFTARPRSGSLSSASTG